MGQFSEAETHLLRSLDLVKGSGDKWLESNSLRVLAVVYRGTGRTDLALKTLRETVQLSTSIGDLHGVTLAMVGLAEFHISQGGHEQAGEYLELAQGRLKEEMYLPVSGLIQRLTGQLEAASGRLAHEWTLRSGQRRFRRPCGASFRRAGSFRSLSPEAGRDRRGKVRI